MFNQLTAGIQLASIAKIQIYLNSGKKTIAQIKAETSADYILPGTLYDLQTGKVNCHLKAAGKVLAAPTYHVYGYSWDTGSDIGIEWLPVDRRDNYIACTPLIVGGQAIPDLTYDSGQGGVRGRVAIGIKDTRLMLYCTADGSSMSRTPEQLRDDLAKAGWRSAIMLDGGTSAQCDFNGDAITNAGRKYLNHLILVFVKKTGGKDPDSSTTAMKTGQAGLDLIKSFEGLRLSAYKAVPTEKYYTIGYGHYSADVKQDQTITTAQADAFLRQDLATAEKSVNGLNRALTQNQFDALVSFAFNCGAGSLNALCKNRTLPQIADAMLLYNKAGGNALAGLTRRREAERKLFLSADKIASVASSGTHAVSASGGLRMRSQASTSANTLLTIPDGTKLTPVRMWAEVNYGGKHGFVAADYLEKL